MQDLKKLVDRAAKVCGNDKTLADRMGVHVSDVSHLRTGRRPFSPEVAAEIADIARENAVQAALDAIIIRARGTRKEEMIEKVLGKKEVENKIGAWECCFTGSSISNVTNINKRKGLTYLYEQRMQFVT